MPAKSDKRAVMGCKKSGKCSPETKAAAKSMTMKQVKDFLTNKKK